MGENYTIVELTALIKEKAQAYERIKSPQNVFEHLAEYIDKEQEYFLLLTLAQNSRIIDTHEVTIGILNQSLAHPREIFRRAILDNASGIIVAHNHPSGEPTPSSADSAVTRRLKEVGNVIGIELLDHVIISQQGWYSYLEEGEL